MFDERFAKNSVFMCCEDDERIEDHVDFDLELISLKMKLKGKLPSTLLSSLDDLI
jgi:hypothetical protein